MPNEKQRRAAERRRTQRQRRRRYERYLRRRRLLVSVTVLGVLALVALVVTFVVVTGDEDPTPAATSTKSSTTSPATSPSATPASSAAALPRYPCTYAKSGTAAKAGVSAPTVLSPPRTGKVRVSVTTNRGPMTFTLDRSLAPCAVNSFVSLVKAKYYDSTPCHRLVTDTIFVLQCGDPLGTGNGGPGYTVNDEGTDKETYKAGAIAMARTQAPNSSGSQFFIVYKDSPALIRKLGLQQYTEFGTVTSGLSVVTKVAAGGVSGGGTDGKPKLPLTVSTMKS